MLPRRPFNISCRRLRRWLRRCGCPAIATPPLPVCLPLVPLNPSPNAFLLFYFFVSISLRRAWSAWAFSRSGCSFIKNRSIRFGPVKSSQGDTMMPARSAKRKTRCRARYGPCVVYGGGLTLPPGGAAACAEISCNRASVGYRGSGCPAGVGRCSGGPGGGCDAAGGTPCSMGWRPACGWGAGAAPCCETARRAGALSALEADAASEPGTGMVTGTGCPAAASAWPVPLAARKDCGGG